jgi:glycosyltransferase involved in cell wall biosynthesis
VPKISVTVITCNESQNIRAALESVRWADEIVVVDANSTDDTIALARTHTDRVLTRAWDGYSAQKNFAASEARHDWILSIDADERVSPGLADEIQRLMRDGPASRGYRIPRVAWHLGRWLRSTDWYPDPQLRLYDRRAGSWTARRVHESVRIEGPVGTLTGELLHYPYRDIAHHLETINRYTALAANDLFDRGRRAGVVDLITHPPLAFARNYLLRGGVRDGAAGFVVSAMNAYYVFLKFAKLWELQSRGTVNPEPREPVESEPS